MPSWPYDPTSRDTATNIDWVRVHPQSMQSPARRWRRVALADLAKLSTHDAYKRVYDALPMEIKAEITRRLEHNEEADSPREDVPRSSKEQILKRVDDTIEDAELDGDLVAKLRGLELMAKVEQLLSTKVQQDPQITINVITNVPRSSDG